MARPTFNGAENYLVTDGEKQFVSGIQTRMYMETIPDVNGMWYQGHGIGGRQIVVTGWVVGTSTGGSATALSAHDAAMQAYRDNCDKFTDGTSVGDYIGTDEETYENCVCTKYEMSGRAITTGGDNCGYTVRIPINALIVQLSTDTP